MSRARTGSVGKWVPCTPEWVEKWGACGATIRRTTIEPCNGPTRADRMHYHATGHEHLMLYSCSREAHAVPLAHESGEPQ